MLPSKDVLGLDVTGVDVTGVDVNVLAALPDVDKVVEVTAHAISAWARTYCLKIQHLNGDQARYFMKVSIGHHGREALKGEFTSTSAIHSIVPHFCPKPIASGTFGSDPDSHFYLCKFHDFYEGLPDPKSFCKSLVQLHTAESPNGMFGFECATYNGNLPQDNTWHDSWETFFANGLHHVLRLREERGGPVAELDAVLPLLFDVVIPRLLRPLETDGRKVKPSLVHGDLWCGNAGLIDKDLAVGIVYDPASFWAHNEYELGNWRPERNKFTQEYFQAYHSHIAISEPMEDFDDRNALYALKFNLHAAAIFPDNKTAIEEIYRLDKKFVRP